jgi:glycosyltransferase involved in cell wall biosynthesis
MLKISFVIPTLDRPQELKRLLDSFAVQTIKPNEIIIVDQSKTNNKAIEQYNPVKSTGADHWAGNITIKYHTVDFQSLTKARNFGVKQATGDIIGFLDDDIVLDKDYLKNILSFFDSYPNAKGVQGLITNFEAGHAQKVGGNKMMYRLYNLFAKVFLLNNSSTCNKLLKSGRNQYASRIKKVVNCEWLSGIGNYRKEIFNEFTFDENLQGYALGEDKLFSYPIFQKHPNSLFMDPSIRCEHHHANFGRPQDEEWVRMKILYTYYLWEKLFYPQGFLAYLSYFWADIGDLLVVFFSVLTRQNSFKFFGWHIKWYRNILCRKNITI